MYLLDTNIISASRRRTQHNTQVFDWLANIREEALYTSVVVFMELERGILSMERKDEAQGHVLRTWFETVVKPSFSGRLLGIDQQTANLCSRLHIPDHMPENDAWIAATTIQHRLTLVTRNTTDFRHIGVSLINPYTFGSGG